MVLRIQYKQSNAPKWLCQIYNFMHRVMIKFSDFSDAQDKRIKDLFVLYDIGEKGYLSESDFLEFYKQSCEKKPKAVWANLNYRNIYVDL